MTGKTEKGFCFDVDDSVINSWKTTKIFSELTDKKTGPVATLNKTFEFADRILGDGEQQDEFVKFMDAFYGREASYEEVIEELFEIYTLSRTDSKN